MRITSLLTLVVALVAGLPAVAAAQQANVAAGEVLPRPPQPYEGRLEPTEAESTPFLPEQVRAPEGAPNILLVMTDDVGFGAASTFGGPVPTPNLDQLAGAGLRYNRFHTTGICSPTRAALLTGRNHHAVGTGTLVDLASPYPGYTTVIPPSAATVARILRDNGYNTAMFGKDHNVPGADRSLMGPFDQWPTGRGFEYFYGFVGGDTDQWQPALYEGTRPVEPPRDDPDYLLDRDLVDHAIDWLRNQQAASRKPFFIYLAPGTAHAPLQAPAEWIARFRGQFDQGWDQLREDILARQKELGVVPANTELTARPAEIPAWDSLSATERKVYARYMELFAAVLSYQDAQFGRLLAELERLGLAENTLVVFIEGDNGASGEGGVSGTLNELAHLSSAESEHPVALEWLADNLDILGGPDTYAGYPVGWAHATSTPYPWVKQIASHLGGVRNPLVISWPERIEGTGGLREQYHHVIDIMPTLLDAAGVQAPVAVDGIEQQPVDGTSMVYTFDAPQAPSTRRTQYYEIMGNRGIYHEGWLAGTTPRNMPWDVARSRKGSDITTYPWELYDLRSDFSQAHNLADSQPEKLRELQAVFDREARRYNVYPIHDSGAMLRAMKMGSAGPMGNVKPETVLSGPDIRLSLMASPPIFFLPFAIEAEVAIPDGGADGVIVAAGSWFGGWSFYLHDGKPVAVAAVSPLDGGQSRVSADRAVPAGEHKVRYEFVPGGEGGEVILSIDGEEVGRGPVASRPRIMAGLGETFDTGRDTLVPVSTEYTDEGVFTGRIDRVTVSLPLPGKRKQP